MAKLSSVNKNNRRKKMAKKYAARWAKLKAIAENEKLPMDERFTARLKMQALPRNSHPTRIRNRCALTGRARGNYRKFGISRLMLRELASKGLIPGVTKSSW
jgi:small subunit ribosomal protein S14